MPGRSSTSYSFPGPVFMMHFQIQLLGPLRSMAYLNEKKNMYVWHLRKGSIWPTKYLKYFTMTILEMFLFINMSFEV